VETSVAGSVSVGAIVGVAVIGVTIGGVAIVGVGVVGGGVDIIVGVVTVDVVVGVAVNVGGAVVEIPADGVVDVEVVVVTIACGLAEAWGKPLHREDIALIVVAGGVWTGAETGAVVCTLCQIGWRGEPTVGTGPVPGDSAHCCKTCI